MSAQVGYANGIKELLAHADGMVQNLSMRTESSIELDLLEVVHQRLLRCISDIRTYATEHDLEATLEFSLARQRLKNCEVLSFPIDTNAG